MVAWKVLMKDEWKVDVTVEWKVEWRVGTMEFVMAGWREVRMGHL